MKFRIFSYPESSALIDLNLQGSLSNFCQLARTFYFLNHEKCLEAQTSNNFFRNQSIKRRKRIQILFILKSKDKKIGHNNETYFHQ